MKGDSKQFLIISMNTPNLGVNLLGGRGFVVGNCYLSCHGNTNLYDNSYSPNDSNLKVIGLMVDCQTLATGVNTLVLNRLKES